MAIAQMQPVSFASALEIEPRKEVDAEVSSASTNEPAGRSRADSTESLESVELESLESLEAEWQRCQAEQATPCTPMMAVSYMLAVMPDGRQCWMPMAMPVGQQMGMAMPMSMAMATPMTMPVAMAPVPVPDADALAVKASALDAQLAEVKTAAKHARAMARAARNQARAGERRRLRTLLSELRRRRLAGELYSDGEADASSFEDDGSESAFDL